MLKPDSTICSLASLSEFQRVDVLNRLSPGEIRALLKELDAVYSSDFWTWLLCEVRTQDEATQKILPWPDKEYLRDIADALASEQLLIIPKSRRMMVTWLAAAAWPVFNARFFTSHAIFVQSQTEEKAAFVTDKRCVFIEQNLREPLLRRSYRPIKTHEGLVGRITYDETGSYIWAIPQGGSVIRTFTFSILVMDESDFQDEGGDALNAALAIAEDNKAAKIVLITTSNGPTGVAAEICRGANFSRWS